MGIGRNKGVWIKESLHWVSEFKLLDLREFPAGCPRKAACEQLGMDFRSFSCIERILQTGEGQIGYLFVKAEKGRASKYKSAS